MKRHLSILLSLTGVLLLIAWVSACKPEARNSPSQQAGTAIAQPAPTATAASAASTVAVTSTVSKPPACQFKNTTAPVASSPAASYIFSEPRVVFTSTTNGVHSI